MFYIIEVTTFNIERSTFNFQKKEKTNFKVDEIIFS